MSNFTKFNTKKTYSRFSNTNKTNNNNNINKTNNFGIRTTNNSNSSTFNNQKSINSKPDRFSSSHQNKQHYMYGKKNPIDDEINMWIKSIGTDNFDEVISIFEIKKINWEDKMDDLLKKLTREHKFEVLNYILKHIRSSTSNTNKNKITLLNENVWYGKKNLIDEITLDESIEFDKIIKTFDVLISNGFNFIDFSLGAMDEIINQAAKIRFMFNKPVPLVIRATSGVALGGAHHCNSLESFFAHTAGLSLAVPSTPMDVKGLIKTALRNEDPVIFLMHKKLSGIRGEIKGDDYFVPFGKAATIKSGKDAVIISYGYSVVTANKAAQALEAEGISVEVIDLRTLYPLDTDAINAAVQKFGRVVVVDEAPLFGSITAEIAATATEANFGSLKGPIVRVGAIRAPLSANPAMSEAAIPSVDSISAAVKKVMKY